MAEGKLTCPKCGFEAETTQFLSVVRFHPGCWLYLLGVLPGLVWTIYWLIEKDKTRCPKCRKVW